MTQGTRLWRLELAHFGIVPDMVPEGSLGRHAANAIFENWNMCLFGGWNSIAQGYVRDHYRPHPELSPRGAAERRLDLETSLRDCMKALGGEAP